MVCKQPCERNNYKQLIFLPRRCRNTNGVGNEVWNSGDGTNWTCVTHSAAFSSRGNHTSVAFNNSIWVIGGGENGNGGSSGPFLNDAWYSQ